MSASSTLRRRHKKSGPRGTAFLKRDKCESGGAANRHDQTNEDQRAATDIIERVIVDARLAVDRGGHVVTDALCCTGDGVFALIAEIKKNAAEGDEDNGEECFIHDEAWDGVVVV